MDKKKLIDQEVQKILQQFDQSEKIGSDPFFSTRVMSRIRDLNKTQTDSGIFSVFENVLRPAFILGIVVLNLITASFILSQQDNQSNSESQVIYSFAEEYSFTQNDYDILKMKEMR